MAAKDLIFRGIGNSLISYLLTKGLGNFTPGVAPTIILISPAYGSMYGKDTITITGTNFETSQGNGCVKFNGVLVLEYISWSDTEIICISPPGTPDTIDVVVQNNAGNSVTSSDAFTYTESLYEQIINALIYGLGKITTDGGYNYTIKKVYDPPVGIDEMYDYPSVNIEEESESCSNPQTHVQTGGNEATLLNNFNVRLDCVVQSTENPRLARNQILADVQKYFGYNWNIPDSSGLATAFNCFYSGCVPWGMHETKPLTGISILFTIWYKQKLTDPAKMG